jgi:hypothetical protein
MGTLSNCCVFVNTPNKDELSVRSVVTALRSEEVSYVFKKCSYPERKEKDVLDSGD